MTEQELKQLIKIKDSQTLEFKESTGEKNEINQKLTGNYDTIVAISTKS